MSSGHDQNPETGEDDCPEQVECQPVIAVLRGEEEHVGPHASPKRVCRYDRRAGPQNWLLGLRPGGLRRLSCGQSGGEVGGDRDQLRISPRRERLA